MKARLITGCLAMTATLATGPWVMAQTQSDHDATAVPQANKSHKTHVKLSQNEVREVQQALHNEGHYNGPIDGLMGPRTRQAVEKFQAAHNLKSNGRIDENTLAALNIKTSDTMGASGTRSDTSTPPEAPKPTPPPTTTPSPPPSHPDMPRGPLPRPVPTP